jgi:hypothetical protein
MDPRAGLEVVAKREIVPCWESIPGRLARGLVTSLTELLRILRDNREKITMYVNRWQWNNSEYIISNIYKSSEDEFEGMRFSDFKIT